jgi:hypothetical protein
MLVSCQPVPGQLPPQWAITDTLVNANSPGFNQGEARTIVFFSKIPWQSSYPRQANFASGWRNDVLVSNPYSFQVIVSGGNFLNGGLILRDVATGQEIQVTAPRVNHSFDCGASLSAQPNTIQCFRDPGSSSFVQRPTLPTNTASYSVELVESCKGVLKYTDLRCPVVASKPNGPQASTDAVTVLTISPPISPSVPIQGQKFDYDLVSRNSNGDKSTRIRAVYVTPSLCKIDDLVLIPTSVASGSVGNAGDVIQVEWRAQNCFQSRVTTNDPDAPSLDYWQVAQSDEASESNESRSVAYLLPKIMEVDFKLEASDAMERSVTLTRKQKVSACSVDPQSTDCPTRCSTVPKPPGCPTLPPPSCPVGQGDTNRQALQFSFTILCSGSNTTHQETDYGCTKDDALQAAKNRWQGSNCAPTGMGVLTSPDSGGTMPPAQACMNSATEQDWKVCLMCGTTSSTLTIKACSLDDATAKAELNCPNQLATVSAGECQKP